MRSASVPRKQCLHTTYDTTTYIEIESKMPRGTHVELVCSVDAHPNERVDVIVHGLFHLIEQSLKTLPSYGI